MKKKIKNAVVFIVIFNVLFDAFMFLFSRSAYTTDEQIVFLGLFGSVGAFLLFEGIKKVLHWKKVNR